MGGKHSNNNALIFSVVAEPPESPRNCIVRNATQYGINDVDDVGGGEGAKGGLEISCIAGKDGGLHQSFMLEVSDVSIPALPPGVTTLSDQGLLYKFCIVSHK